MKTIDLEIELLSDLCLSTSNRTLGEQETFTHIPGRTIWGAVASAAYRARMPAEKAFALFQQGQVRIQNGVPFTEEGRAHPWPLAWHVEKGRHDSPVFNQAHENPQKDLQLKGRGSGWATASGEIVKIEPSYTLRTSIGPSGRARAGLLFGIPTIPAGTRYVCSLSGPDAGVDEVCQLMLKAPLRLGRSRNTELGLVRVKALKSPMARLQHGQGEATRFSILCDSRCLLRDRATGAPSLRPDPSEFGLPQGWEFAEEASFLKATRITHFNSQRGRPERDRIALEQGSVITFRGGAPVDLAEVIQVVEGGVGDDCGQGYGQVVVAPTWLTAATITLVESDKFTPKSPPAPQDKLFEWASQRAESRKSARSMYELAAAFAQELAGAQRVGSSQWGVLHRMAREHRFGRGQQLLTQLKTFLDSGQRKLDKRWQRVGETLLERCQSKDVTDLPLFLEHLAGAAMRAGRGGDRE